MRRCKIILILIALFFLRFHSSGMRTDSAQQNKIAKELQHEVTVTLKLIQVYVTDSQGNPVTDLEKSDFELYDNGKRKTLTEFEKHVLFSPPPTQITIEKKTQTPPAMKLNRKFILFFDFAFNSAQGIRRAVKAASHFIDTHLIPSDEVSVISYSARRGLTLHSYLTTDHQTIRGIVKRFGIKEVLGRAEDQLQNWDYRYNIIKYSREIRDLAKALGYVPGQKQIIFFSSGIKYSELCPVRSLIVPPTMIDYEEMTKELAASNCTVHSVYTAASDEDMDLGLDRDVYISGRSDKDSAKKDIKETGVFSLGRLSEVTGGRYFGSIFQYERIMEEIQKITASFYVLGYYINESWDAKYHRIEVKVNRKGCQVHAQKGYFNPKPFTRFSKIEKELHLMGLAVNRKSPFGDPQEFPLITLPFSDKEGPNVVLLSEIDPVKMREVLAGEVEMATFILNPMYEILDQVRIKMDLSNVSEKKNYLYSIFSLEPGDYECCSVLRNLKTGEAAAASSSVSIPVSYSGIHLFKPLLFLPDEEATYIHAEKGKEEGNSGILDLKKIYPSISSQSSVLFEGVDKEVSRLLAEVRCLFVGSQESEIELSACLIPLPRTQEAIPLSLSILSYSERNEMGILLLELPLPKLEIGQYSLKIVANEIKTQSTSQVSLSFKIKNKI